MTREQGPLGGHGPSGNGSAGVFLMHISVPKLYRNAAMNLPASVGDLFHRPPAPVLATGKIGSLAIPACGYCGSPTNNHDGILRRCSGCGKLSLVTWSGVAGAEIWTVSRA